MNAALDDDYIVIDQGEERRVIDAFPILTPCVMMDFVIIVILSLGDKARPKNPAVDCYSIY